MSYILTDPVAGSQPIANTSTVKLHTLGKCVNATDPTYGDGEFVYLLGLAATAVGEWVTYNADDYTTAKLANSVIGPWL